MVSKTYLLKKDGYPDILLDFSVSYPGDGTYFSLQLGSKKKMCVFLTLNEVGHIHRGKDESHIADLSWIEHDVLCGVNKDLDKHDGTKHLMKLILDIVKHNFAWITQVKLTDGSKFDCENPYKGKISRKIMLAYYNLALYGKTWYEAHFKAKLLNAGDDVLLKENVNRFNDPSIKLPWNIFRLRYRIQEYEDILKTAYETSNTYREWLTLLRKDKITYCWYIRDWIVPFVDDVLDHIPLSRWVIDIDDINDYQYTVFAVETNKKGGQYKKATRKNVRKHTHYNQTEYELL